MALVIRYRCHTCGAHVDSAGQVAWVRCGYCRALVGYDWQAWFESPEYAAWLRSYPALAPGFTDFQKEVEAAREAARQGLLDEAGRSLRQAVDRVMGLTPQHYPPEVQQDPAYRQRYIRYDAWVRLQWMVDPVTIPEGEMVVPCSVCGARVPGAGPHGVGAAGQLVRAPHPALPVHGGGPPKSP